ncbi:hypothetical protein [Alcanivorax sp.]|uniref:hypothetical protein n=1 Tax=Alcanivorax sp. TaxID=1872427 RepID=UPI003BACECC8
MTGTVLWVRGFNDGACLIRLKQITGRQPFVHHGCIDAGDVMTDIQVGGDRHGNS